MNEEHFSVSSLKRRFLHSMEFDFSPSFVQALSNSECHEEYIKSHSTTVHQLGFAKVVPGQELLCFFGLCVGNAHMHTPSF